MHRRRRRRGPNATLPDSLAAKLKPKVSHNHLIGDNKRIETSVGTMSSKMKIHGGGGDWI